MKLILISDNGSHHRKFNFSWRTVAVLLLVSSLIAITVLLASTPSKQDVISKNEIQLLNEFDSMRPQHK